MGSGLMLMKTLLVLMGAFLVPGAERRLKRPAAHFLLQTTSECHLANGSAGQVWFLEKYFYDRQEILRFDSRRGDYQALAPMAEPDAQYWNSQEEYMAYQRALVDNYCRPNYALTERILSSRRVEPLVKISHTKASPLAHHSVLLCTVTGYYPSEVKIQWLRNGQEQTEGVGYDDEVQNGDWTFQNQAMLETVPVRGDVYACQVEHSSLKEPITVQWEPQMSESSKSKMWTGGVGALLGVVFGAVGLSLYLKNRKASPAAPAVGLIG